MNAEEDVVWVVALIVFTIVTMLSLWMGLHASKRGRIRQRLQVDTGGTGLERDSVNTLKGIVKATIGDESIGLDQGARAQLRMELLRAGFFSADAPFIFTLVKSVTVIFLPTVLYIVVLRDLAHLQMFAKTALLGGAFLLSYYLPQAYIRRRQRLLAERYKIAFPDFLDLMVVCVDSGLSLEAALERVGAELQTKEPELGFNLALMGSEMRAGRSTIDALHSLANRLGLDEARALTMLLQQSLELGTDIAQSLRTFSDEMRDKRLSRAEERAHALPVKLVLPLGAFIFPVLLLVIMTPILIRILGAFGRS
ncbi:type II secretion system F family protein [Chelatococcus sp. SYSU_G07232]|uniref:Type II secretion system F family protein n=1 Tax=Chelatococcus albus TaxID=3047466 RepID=A0ABT7AIL1_9HYPH|nr:type II secretion system F family protein [Chelatococcus sp. SYSU_G07232]MDJ1159210.1 type II secretion system F family protein [Chelatococcus sp. SYSU_G07232]